MKHRAAESGGVPRSSGRTYLRSIALCLYLYGTTYYIGIRSLILFIVVVGDSLVIPKLFNSHFVIIILLLVVSTVSTPPDTNIVYHRPKS